MRSNPVFKAMAIVLILFPATALAKPQVTISVAAETETVVVEGGAPVTKRVPAKEIEPGQVLFYTLKYTNGGDEKATRVVVDDPIPEGTVFIPDSATGPGAAITFSIDGGQSFNPPALLFYEVKQADGTVEKRKAAPEQYTHIRWNLKEIPAGDSGQLDFQVRVK